VVIGDKKSSWTEVSSGVPQGSVLGPLLFIIYINDLVRELKSIVKIYADETKLIADVQEPEGAKQLQEDLNRINEWTKRWLIKLNS
jgi:ribonucleases P/MRP protein subunit RPP40